MPVIHAQFAHCVSVLRRLVPTLDSAQDRVAADGNRKAIKNSVARLTARRVPDNANNLQQPICPTSMILHNIRSTFGKDLAGAMLVPTTKPTNIDVYSD